MPIRSKTLTCQQIVRSVSLTVNQAIWDPSRRDVKLRSISTSAASACARIVTRSVCVTSPEISGTHSGRDGAAYSNTLDPFSRHIPSMTRVVPFLRLQLDENAAAPENKAQDPRDQEIRRKPDKNFGVRVSHQAPKHKRVKLFKNSLVHWQLSN